MNTASAPDIFLSYKREDEARVARLAAALEAAGFSVYWDRELRAGGDWHAQLTQALTSAKLVIVCWSFLSVGPDGGFVQDEARHGQGRGKLLPVFLDRVSPPLGFGMVQGVDLSHWRGAPKDPFLQDLIAAAKALRDGAPAPKPKGPGRRALSRFLVGGGALTVALAAMSFAWSTPIVREGLCALPVGQPGLARTCCTAGWTEKTLQAAPKPKRTELVKQDYERQSQEFSPTEDAARALTLSRLEAAAARSCALLTKPEQALISSTPRDAKLRCDSFERGTACAADFTTVCVIDVPQEILACPGEGE
jgi:hypothetical protein